MVDWEKLGKNNVVSYAKQLLDMYETEKDRNNGKKGEEPVVGLGVNGCLVGSKWWQVVG